VAASSASAFPGARAKGIGAYSSRPSVGAVLEPSAPTNSNAPERLYWPRSLYHPGSCGFATDIRSEKASTYAFSWSRWLLTPSNALRNLYLIVKKANDKAEGDDDRLPRFHIHDLRHTYATHLLMDRWDVARVARRLGHANPAITLKLCAHAITDVQGDEIVTPAAFAFAGTA